MDLKTLKKHKRLLDAAEGYLLLELAPQALAALEQIPCDTEDQAVALAADILRGEVYRSLHRYHEALDACQRAIRQRPKDVSLLLMMAWCYKRTDELPRAIAALEEASRIDSRQAIIPYNLACYFSLAGEKEKALGHLERALRIDKSFRDQIDDESDFDGQRHDYDFQELLARFSL
jgi:tetratricopeptide (TPR) repeat protein